jgi:AbrB family looped-hinge helix DNA binding protein
LTKVLHLYKLKGMTTTVSPKYQIVIPKAVRRQIEIKPGQKMQVEAADNGDIIVRHGDRLAGYDKLAIFAGSIKTKDTSWGKQGLDASAWIRRQRDENWD